jgi:DNA-binding NarL/FixJ family response regulator
MAETIRVLVIEQDSIHREGLVACLSQESDIMVVGIGGDVAEALDTASSPIEPDVLIINLDQAITTRTWTLIGLALPSISIIGLTEGNNNRILEIALVARVSALLRSSISPTELCDSLRTVIRGTLYYDPALTMPIKKMLMHPPISKELQIGNYAVVSVVGDVKFLGEHPRLTTREQDVLNVLGKGKTNRQIARVLNISERTVEYHMSNLMRKLAITSRIEAAFLGLFTDG